jgi:PhnB protein
MRIGDSIVMVSDGGGLRESWPAFLYVYVEDVDETYRRATDASAVSIEAPIDTPYGDRRATIQDPWGNMWQVATRQVLSGD